MRENGRLFIYLLIHLFACSFLCADGCACCTATYGGHLELSAFAHLKRRNVKVIQPGLVYVIEWQTGGEPSSPPHSPRAEEHMGLDERERRRLRREKERKRVDGDDDDGEDEDGEDGDSEQAQGAIYVAYVLSASQSARS